MRLFVTGPRGEKKKEDAEEVEKKMGREKKS